jgi:hypothetical protein
MSRFGDLKTLRQNREQTPVVTPVVQVESTPLELEIPPAQPILPIARGRKPSPLSKSRDPQYRQRSLWLKDATYFATEVQLIERHGKSKDMSDLVGELLEQWCAAQVGKSSI